MIELNNSRSANCSPTVTRVYATHADRKRALKQLRRRFNYFVLYQSSTPGAQGPALSYGCAVWCRVGEYINY